MSHLTSADTPEYVQVYIKSMQWIMNKEKEALQSAGDTSPASDPICFPIYWHSFSFLWHHVCHFLIFTAKKPHELIVKRAVLISPPPSLPSCWQPWLCSKLHTAHQTISTHLSPSNLCVHEFKKKSHAHWCSCHRVSISPILCNNTQNTGSPIKPLTYLKNWLKC